MRSFRLKISDLFDFEGKQPPAVNPSPEDVRRLVQRQFAFLGAAPDVTIEGDEVSLSLPDSPEPQRAEAERLAAKAGQRAAEGNYQKAIAILKRVLELNPTFQRARRDLAMVYSETGDTDAAISNLIDALRLDNRDAWSFVVLANLYIGKKKDIDTAERFLRRALEIAPNDGWALNSLAAVAGERGDIDQAVKLFNQAIDANPDFPNPYYGKASALSKKGKALEAVEVLDSLFTRAKRQDVRSDAVFQQARQAYGALQEQSAIANESDGFKAVNTFKQELEKASAFPIRVQEADFKDGAGARIQMAWKHGRDYHLLLTRRGFPAHLLYHLEAHELTHLRLEVEARKAGRNRFFTTNARTRETAEKYVGQDFRQWEKKGYPKDAIARASEAMVSGLCGFVFNCPLDMVIESELRAKFPTLHAAQFVSVGIMANEAKETVTNAELQRLTPRKIAAASNALNGAYSLFLDSLFNGASDFAKWYRSLPTFQTSTRLFEHWKAKAKTLGAGDEYQLVDDFAEMTGLRGWYEWQPDSGRHTVSEAAPLEGTTNVELLRQKHPAAVFHMLGALKRFDGMRPEQIKAIALEIAIVGQRGLDYSDPAQKYSLRSIPGEMFSGLQLMCLMFAGFKRFAPDHDVGMDLEDPFLTALQLFRAEKGDK